MIRSEPETQVKCEFTAELSSSSCKQLPPYHHLRKMVTGCGKSGETKQVQGIKLGEGGVLEESPSGFWEYIVYDEI